MAERKPLSKKIRFEVFKRDSFTCQYCGRMAPDVILEVDHIIPVAKGGTNKITNLITSCHDCNSGKSDRELSDDSVIKRQQAQMLILAQKKEQLEMMAKWREKLDDLENEQVKLIESYTRKLWGLKNKSLSDRGIKSVKKWLKDYTYLELTNAVSELSNQYDTEEIQNNLDKFFFKIPTVARYKKNPWSEEQKQIFYLRKILINRLSYLNRYEAYGIIENALKVGCTFDEIKTVCCTCRTWTDFKDAMDELMSFEG